MWPPVSRAADWDVTRYDRLPEALRQAFVEQVVDEVVRREGGLCLDYVRLTADAAG